MAISSNKRSRAQAETGHRSQRISHVVGFDDAPFERSHRGDVLVVGAVFAGDRLDGVISTRVRRDGANAAQRLIDCLTGSRYFDQLHAILLQGIAFAGFNVVDLQRLHEASGCRCWWSCGTGPTCRHTQGPAGAMCRVVRANGA